MDGPVLVYKLHGKVKTVTVNDVYLLWDRFYGQLYLSTTSTNKQYTNHTLLETIHK